MKNSRLVFAAMGLVVACAGVRAEPLADFDALVAHCKEAFNERPMSEVAYAESAGTWVKRAYAPVAIKYRMQKTGSKVTPFVAQIEITELASARRGDDEDSVRAMTVAMDENLMRSVRSINFAYQDDAWVALGASVVTEVKRDASDEFSVADSARLSRGALLEAQGPVATCASGNRY